MLFPQVRITISFYICLKGLRGLPGDVITGRPGSPGRPGLDGLPGDTGLPGRIGINSIFLNPQTNLCPGSCLSAILSLFCTLLT